MFYHQISRSVIVKSYDVDITYGNINELGFDYLRDNMKFSIKELVQRDHYFAIADEVDNVLIDEARTPLVITGPAEQSTHLYSKINAIIQNLKKDDDFTIDKKSSSSVLTDNGIVHVEKLLEVDNLYDPKNIELFHHVNLALKAHTLFKRNEDYVIKNNEVILVDQVTGRLTPARRYSDGLHQALEAKEHVKIENENQTLARITIFDYLSLYEKFAGMTSTATYDINTYKHLYNLDIYKISTLFPKSRKDYQDVIYKTKKEKYVAILNEIKDCYNRGQPVLINAQSLNVAEYLSKEFKRLNIHHNLLNAKHHEKESDIISLAGQKKSVTISTRIAGWGTDIILGEDVRELGGLHIIGTERSEKRRSDERLQNLAGRCGDPGSSIFYMSLEDDLLRIFGGERIQSIMNRCMDEGDRIEHKLITQAIERAQLKVEGHHSDILKQLFEYDNVINQQRKIIYQQRREALIGKNLRPYLFDMIADIADNIAFEFADDRLPSYEWDWEALNDKYFQFFYDRVHPDKNVLDGLTAEGLCKLLKEQAIKKYTEQEELIGVKEFIEVEQMVTLQMVDRDWKNHLFQMDHLKEDIGLRAHAQQQNSLIAYKREAFEMFQDMIARMKKQIIGVLFRIERIEPEDLVKNKVKKEPTVSNSKCQDLEKKKVKRK